MFILSRKRITLVILCIIISISTFLINNKKNESIETVGLPCSNKVVIIDAGHGPPDEGAEGSKRSNRSIN